MKKLSQCPVCLERVEESEMIVDPEAGKCCCLCAEYYQNERDFYEDCLRKIEKENFC